MTRRDFLKLSAALREARPGPPQFRSIEQQVWMEAVCKVCDAIAEDNPRFDRARFLENAGTRR